MMTAVVVLFAATLPQDPSAVAEEAKARANLSHAAQHIDELLLHANQARDRALAALQLTRTTEAAATQADRARLAKVAADLTAQLASLESSIQTHVLAIKALRVAVTAEIPAPVEGSIPWFRDRMQAARKMDPTEKAISALRAIESELQADGVKAKPGASPLLGHVRFVLAEALRGSALDAQRKNRTTDAVARLRDASKKLDQVRASPDSTDTGEGSSLYAAALRRKVEIEAALYLAFVAQPRGAATAERHRQSVNNAFDTLRQEHADDTLPDGTKAIDAALTSVEQMRQSALR